MWLDGRDFDNVNGNKHRFSVTYCLNIGMNLVQKSLFNWSNLYTCL